ncbi:unnamed protein product [Lepeophtheirus salmonis]|uniref:(salmon louse) hypothetical protein n=1 Tax=Lepeophtheirus salmonis TaxID=72036 RepID=A0A7R8HB10_LEPSM|nr:unnamed protein product [Lepeophtheirus salmonis]CAF2966887.1 unnamed protein product [Lepeophtheirus salmonis]
MEVEVYIPPRAPNQERAWEALIKSQRLFLNRHFRLASLNFEKMMTALRSTTSSSSARNGAIPCESRPARMVRKSTRKNANPKANITLVLREPTTPDDNPLSTPHTNTLSDLDPTGVRRQLFLTHPSGHGKNNSSISEKKLSRTTTLCEERFRPGAQMNAQTNSLMVEMRTLLSQSPTADPHTSTTQASSQASQPIAATTPLQTPAAMHRLKVALPSPLTKPSWSPKIEKLLDTANIRQFHHWRDNWNASFGAQNFASLPHKHQIWTFLSALGTHSKQILEYSYKIDYESSDLTVNVLLNNLHPYYRGKKEDQDSDDLVALKSQSTAPHGIRTDPTCPANGHSCNKKGHYASMSHSSKVPYVYVANVDKQSPESRSTKFCELRSINSHFFSKNEISLGSLRNVFPDSSTSVNPINTQKTLNVLGFNINTGTKPEVKDVQMHPVLEVLHINGDSIESTPTTTTLHPSGVPISTNQNDPEAGEESIFTPKESLFRKYSDVFDTPVKYLSLYLFVSRSRRGSIKLNPEASSRSPNLTTFIISWGHYKHLRATMGLLSTGDEYNPWRDEAIAGIDNVEKVADDMILYDSAMHLHEKNTTQELRGSRVILTPYDYKTVLKRGKDNRIADALSHTHVDKPTKRDNDFTRDMYRSIHTIKANLLDTFNNSINSQIECDPITLEGIAHNILEKIDQQNINPMLKPSAKILPHLTIHDNFILFGDRIIIPRLKRDQILQRDYAPVIKGHQLRLCSLKLGTLNLEGLLELKNTPLQYGSLSQLQIFFGRPMTSRLPPHNLSLSEDCQELLTNMTDASTNSMSTRETTKTRQQISSNPSLLAPRSGSRIQLPNLGSHSHRSTEEIR